MTVLDRESLVLSAGMRAVRSCPRTAPNRINRYDSAGGDYQRADDERSRCRDREVGGSGRTSAAHTCVLTLACSGRVPALRKYFQHGGKAENREFTEARGGSSVAVHERWSIRLTHQHAPREAPLFSSVISMSSALPRAENTFSSYGRGSRPECT